MKDNKLDNIDKLAKDALEDFEVPFEPMEWAAFQQQLKAEGSIDQAAKEALESYEVALPADSWVEFEQLLHQKQRSYRYIWWLKTAEVGAMVLLLLGLSQWLPCTELLPTNDGSQPSALAHTDHQQKETASIATSTPLSDASTGIATSEGSDAEPNAAASSTDAVLAASPESSATANTTTAPTTPLTTTVAPKASQQRLRPSTTEPATKTTAPMKPVASSHPMDAADATNSTATTDASATTNLKETATAAASSPATVLESNAYLQAGNPTTAEEAWNEAFVLIQPIALSQVAPLGQMDPIVEIRKATLELPFQPRHYVGISLGVGANLASSMGNASIGYSAGLTYEREFSTRWAIKTGLTTNLKRYDRSEVVYLETEDGLRYEANQFKTTNLFVLEVPVDVQYTVFRSDKWRLFLATGLSINAISNRTYSGSQELEANGLAIRLDLNSADFERGLLEGASIQNNAFLSVGAGFGIERQLGNALSLYLLPTYRHAITPAGMDYLHQFNVNIGIKSPIVIKKK